jgi:hypothetical protein
LSAFAVWEHAFVIQDVTANLCDLYVVHHEDAHVWQWLGKFFIDSTQQLEMCQEVADERFVDPIRAVFRVLEFVDSELPDFWNSFGCQHGDAGEGIVEFAALGNALEYGGEGGGEFAHDVLSKE